MEEGQLDPNDFVLNDAINSLYSKAKSDADSLWKKKLIIGSIIGLILIIVLSMILVVVRMKNKEDNDKDKEIIAEIDCVYIINDATYSVNILGDEYLKGNNDFDIYIGKEKTYYSKYYSFKEEGRYDVSYKIYSNINMDYMFKGVTTLDSALLISLKSYQ